MTDVTPEDAARLAEIRETHDDPESDPDCDECFLLRLLDARPQGEFVTRETHDVAVTAWKQEVEQRCIWQRRWEDAEEAKSHIFDRLDEARERAESTEAERDRLAAALAAAEARNVELQRSLERIVRECGALNKGPVAVLLAQEALS